MLWYKIPVSRSKSTTSICDDIHGYHIGPEKLLHVDLLSAIIFYAVWSKRNFIYCSAFVH